MSLRPPSGGRHRSTSFKANENQRAETLAAIAASLHSTTAITTHALVEMEESSIMDNDPLPAPSSTSSKHSVSFVNPLYQPAHNTDPSDTPLLPLTKPSFISKSGSIPDTDDALLPDTPIHPPPFLFNFMNKIGTRPEDGVDGSTSHDTTDAPPSATSPTLSMGLKLIEDDQEDVNKMEDKMSEDAQSSLFWSTWFDSEEQAMFDVNSMLSCMDFNAGHLDAWTRYASEYSRSSSPTDTMSLETVKDIVLKFLDLPRPIMQESLVQCLLLEGMVEVFIDFITLTQPHSDVTSQEWIHPLLFKEREVDLSEDELRRSFNVTSVLCDGAGSAQSLVDRTFTRIVKQLMKIFDSGSKGSFRHFRRVFLDLKRNNDRLVDIVLEEISPITGRPYLIEMLRYCADPVIAECLFSVCFHPTSHTTKRKSWFEKILATDFMSLLFTCLTCRDYPALVQGALEVLSRCVEEAANYEHACIVFMPVIGSLSIESDSFFLSQELNALTQENVLADIQSSPPHSTTRYQYGQRSHIVIETLYSLYVKSIPKPKSASMANLMLLTLDEADADTLLKDPPLDMLRHSVQLFLSKHLHLFYKMLFYPHSKSLAPTCSVLMAIEVMYEFIRHGSEAVWKRKQQETYSKYLGSDATLVRDQGGTDDFGSVELQVDTTTSATGSSDHVMTSPRGSEGMGDCMDKLALDARSEYGQLDIDAIQQVPLESLVEWFYTSYAENSVISASIYKLLVFLIQKRTIYWNLCLKRLLLGAEARVSSKTRKQPNKGLLAHLVQGYQDKKSLNRGYTCLLLDQLYMAYEQDVELGTTAFNDKGELCGSPLVRALKLDSEWNRWAPTIELESKQRKQGMWTAGMVAKIAPAAIEKPVLLPTFDIKAPPAPRQKSNSIGAGSTTTSASRPVPVLKSSPFNKSWEGVNLGSSPRNYGGLNMAQEAIDADNLLATLDLLASGATDIDLD